MGNCLWFVIDVSIYVGGLTPAQLEMRRKSERLPQYLKRSIDEYRVALGKTPLWGFYPAYPPHEWAEVTRRRKLGRERQRRFRAKKREATDGTNP